jgi:hypothetical protein
MTALRDVDEAIVHRPGWDLVDRVDLAIADAGGPSP